MDLERSVDRVRVPPALPKISSDWAREVLRSQPKDIVAFSRDYFAKLCEQQEKSAGAVKPAEKKGAADAKSTAAESAPAPADSKAGPGQ